MLMSARQVLLAKNADVPAGLHRVTLNQFIANIQVADNLHRVGIRTFEFTVIVELYPRDR